ncbi:MAG: hypothetical protein V7L23_29405 [Nostoc sp.]
MTIAIPFLFEARILQALIISRCAIAMAALWLKSWLSRGGILFPAPLS